MADDMSRVELGFDSGLIVITSWTRPNGRSWRRAGRGRASCRSRRPTTPTYHIDVSKVGYVKHEPQVGRVGF